MSKHLEPRRLSPHLRVHDPIWFEGNIVGSASTGVMGYGRI